jgi:Cdc6-like AAA superfamily ATPase
VNQTAGVDLGQIQINNYGNKMMSDGVIPLVPNPSNRFTGRTEAITKLKKHFSTNTSDPAQKRMFFLLHGMGGIGKTQICLKFVEEMSDW